MEWEWPEETRFLIATPLSHAGAAFFVPTLLGAALVVLPGFDPTAVLEAIQKYKITATMLVPTMLYILMDHPKIDEYDLSSLETVYYGASAIVADPARRRRSRSSARSSSSSRAVRGADDDHGAAQGEHERHDPSGWPPAAGRAVVQSSCSTTTSTRCPTASRARSASAVRW